MKKFRWVILFVSLILSFSLGARMILSGDYFYLFDQARDYLLTKSIVDTHNLALIGTHSGLGGFFHGPLWLYLLLPIFVIGKGDPFVFTYFYIFLQLLTILVAFLIGLKLYDQKGGLLISLLVALSPVVWSPVVNTIGVNAEPLVFLGLFYFLVNYLRGNLNSFIFASFFAGISLQFETALPLVLIPVMVVAFFLNRKAIKHIKIIILSVFAYLLSVSTFILFDLRHQFLMTKAVLSIFSQVSRGKGFLSLIDRIPAHLNSLAGVYKSVLFNDNYLLLLVAVIIFLFGTFLIFKDKKDKYRTEFIFLLLFPILVYIFFIGYSYWIWPEYVLGLLIPVTIAFYLAIAKIWLNLLGKVITILFFSLTFLNIFMFLQNNYFKSYQPNLTSGSYKNQLAVVEWIYKDAGQSNNGKFGYFVYSPSVYTQGMDYLISWYGKNYPGTSFESQKDRITYLILYPHMDKDEGAYAFWQKNVLRTNGKILITKVFRGEIVVEKLLINPDEPTVDPNYYQGLLFR